MDSKIGLVLEGGGLRGVYTAGVLDYFMDENIYFPYIIGVSMGACNAASYISNQRGRNKIVYTEYVSDKRYLSYTSLLKTGSLFGMKFIFEDIPNKYVPFDYEQFYTSEQEFLITATDCETGKPVYFNKTECKDDIMQAFMASSSLPFISKIVDYKGHKLLDGGISDSIPVRKALEDGNEKIVVVLTRDAEYVKEQFRHKILAALRYRKYPELVKAIINRYKMYNETTKYIKELEKQGKALVIRPTSSLNVSRFERNMNELAKLYELGYKEAKTCGDEVRAFVKS